MLPPNTDPFLPLQEALKGRYWLERELGRGSMGIVYLADEVPLDRPVALKLLPPGRVPVVWRTVGTNVPRDGSEPGDPLSPIRDESPVRYDRL